MDFKNKETCTITELKENTGKMFKTATEQGKAIEITEHGKVIGVIISKEQHDILTDAYNQNKKASEALDVLGDLV